MRVEREDIDFRTDPAGAVLLEVTVHNDGPIRSTPAAMDVGALPLGAFTEPTSVFRLPVPPIAAGGRERLKLDFPASGTPSASPDRLPPDLLRLQDPGRWSWAGGFDVRVGPVRAERQRGREVRFRPGRANFTLFLVGSRPDEFRFDFQGDALGWGPRLHRVLPSARGLIEAIEGEGLAGGTAGQIEAVEPWTWLAVDKPAWMTLSFVPPVDARRGSLAVEVTQRSSGRVGLVEFGFRV
ncbi:MAG: hypothetical protein ISR76_08665 [Planctomycetes bacterium]|nr:hypothetical protein [Planctomycetota bacterium]MBL7009055.1 hypothetical protein [Planctomycetota bacterium]